MFSCWAIVTAGANKYIGRVEEGKFTDRKAKYITLNPCLEYYSDPIQVQSPRGIEVVGRTKCLMAYDHTIGSVAVRMRATTVCFIDDMIPEDKKAYEKMIAETLKNIEEHRLRKTSGIIVASTLPGGGTPDEIGRPKVCG